MNIFVSLQVYSYYVELCIDIENRALHQEVLHQPPHPRCADRTRLDDCFIFDNQWNRVFFLASAERQTDTFAAFYPWH